MLAGDAIPGGQMSDLVTTGPPLLALRWGQETSERDGRRVRAFYPETQHQEPEGYLHGGIAAAALIGAARLLLPVAADVTSVAIALRQPVPLGDDLDVSLGSGDGDTHQLSIDRLLPPDRTDQALATLAHGAVRLAGRQAAPDLADVRQLAGVPIPQPQEHELFAGCWVCGQKNPQGLQLLPGWHAEGRVVESFVVDERYVEGGEGAVSPVVVAAVLSCPTLWAVAHQLDGRPQVGALLARYEVRFHEQLRPSQVVRAIGFEGGRGREVEFGDDRDDDRALHGTSALIDEGGRVYATASATWVAVDQLPAREPGSPTPLWREMPLKGGRPEDRSEDDWGVPLPGRRQEAGPRSDRPA